MTPQTECERRLSNYPWIFVPVASTSKTIFSNARLAAGWTWHFLFGSATPPPDAFDANWHIMLVFTVK